MSRAASTEWRSLPTDDLTRRQKATLRANWGKIVEYLPAPGIAFTWSEAGLSERLKHYLKFHGLMVRDPGNESKWQTSEVLWMWMIANAADDEEIGASAAGQRKLLDDAPSTPSRAAGSGVTRVHTTPGGRGGVEATQVTLAGDPIDPSKAVNREDGVDTALVKRNLSKGQSSDDEARDAGQPPLTRWTGVDTNADKWDVASGSDGLRVRRATGAYDVTEGTRFLHLLR